LKKPTITTACVLATLVLLVAGFAYVTTGDELAGRPSDVMEKGGGHGGGFVAAPSGERHDVAVQRLQDASHRPEPIEMQTPEGATGDLSRADASGRPDEVHDQASPTDMRDDPAAGRPRDRSATATRTASPPPKPSPAQP